MGAFGAEVNRRVRDLEKWVVAKVEQVFRSYPLLCQLVL